MSSMALKTVAVNPDKQALADLRAQIDQLDGIFWIRRLSRLRRDRVVRRFDKLVRTRRGGD